MATVKDILETFAGSMSTRQIFYQVVSRGVIENRPSSYDKVQRLLVNMRRSGDIPYNRIVDRTRNKHQRPGWDGAEALMNAAATQYRRNRWTDQETVVMIACEKQALEGIFAEVCDKYGASLWTCHGYISASFGFEWAQEIIELNNDGKDVFIAYFGDHDPSGLQIEAKVKDELRSHEAVFAWERAGLLHEDFDRFNLINIPVKAGDTRTKAYLTKFGNRAAELDALPPDELRQRIATAIYNCINDESWDRLSLVEQVEKESIACVVDNWNAALEAARSAGAES